MRPSYRLENGIGRGETFLILLFILIGMAGVFSITLAAEKIDINTAPSEDLIKIIHIGEKRALELISLRPFSSLNELTKIKGIGQKRLEDIKNQGLAWVSKIETELQIEPEPFSTSSGGEVFEEAKSPQKEVKETTPEKEIAESLPKKELAAISKQIPKPSQSLFILLIALAVAIFSGIIILILKKKIKHYV